MSATASASDFSFCFEAAAALTPIMMLLNIPAPCSCRDLVGALARTSMRELATIRQRTARNKLLEPKDATVLGSCLRSAGLLLANIDEWTLALTSRRAGLTGILQTAQEARLFKALVEERACSRPQTRTEESNILATVAELEDALGEARRDNVASKVQDAACAACRRAGPTHGPAHSVQVHVVT